MCGTVSLAAVNGAYAQNGLAVLTPYMQIWSMVAWGGAMALNEDEIRNQIVKLLENSFILRKPLTRMRSLGC